MKRWINTFGFLVIAVIALIGCGKSGTEPTDDTDQPSADVKAEVQQLIQEGWTAFESGDFTTAVDKFTQAVVKENNQYDTLRAEALGGRGWSRIYLGELNDARNDFDGANRKSTHPEVKNDIYAGYGLVFNALNQYNSCVKIIEPLLQSTPDYEFSHRPAVNAFRLRLLVAQSYYAMGNFAKVAAHLDILEPDYAPHNANDPEALLQAIERLRNQ